MADNETQLQILLEKWCDQTISKSEVAQLEQLLTDHPGNQQEYLKTLELHGRINRLMMPFSDSEQPLESDSKFANQTTLPVTPAPAPSWMGTWVGVPVTLALVALIAFLAWPSDKNTSDFAAVITKKIDCDMESNRWGNTNEREILVGQTIKLNRGLLEMEFGCGATVALEGPAELDLISGKKAFLHYGNLTAKVPEKARGFTVETPSSISVDLGTEFGVSVNGQGVSETHVFDGEVLVYESSPINAVDKDSEKYIRLSKNQASRVSGKLEDATEFRAAPNQFMRMPAKDEFVLKRNSPFGKNEKLKLWFDAGRGVQTDELLRVVSWGDLATQNNQSSENAWQVKANKRPFLISDGINGMPAVRFMGHENLVTEPLSTGDNFSCILVMKMLPHVLVRGRSAVALNLGESTRGFQLRRHAQHGLGGLQNSRWLGGERTTSGVISSKADLIGVPLVVAYNYSNAADESSMFINSELIGFSDASVAVKLSSKSRMIGSFNANMGMFVGDIAEILVFDSDLSQEKMKSHSRWLMEKYAIAEGIPEEAEEAMEKAMEQAVSVEPNN